MWIDLRRTKQLSIAMAWRGLKGAWRVLLGAVSLFSSVLVLFTVITTLTPGLITGFARQAIERLAELYFGSIDDMATVLMTLLWVQGPYLLAIFAGFLGTHLAQAALQTEVTHGGFELLLSGPYRFAEIFWAWMTSTLLLSLMGWLISSLLVLGAGMITWLISDLSLPFSLEYWLLAFTLPIPVTLWAIFITLTTLLRFPRMIQGRSNLASAVITPLATLPGIVLILLINVFPDVNNFALLLMATAAVLIGTALAGFGLYRSLRVEALLEG